MDKATFEELLQSIKEAGVIKHVFDELDATKAELVKMTAERDAVMRQLVDTIRRFDDVFHANVTESRP